MLTSYNLPTRELLFRLAVNPRVEAPPGALPMRTAMVRHNTESTYVVPGDWPAVDGTGWFHDGAAPAGGSDVEYLIDGPVTFAAMLEAMETATGAGHFIVLLGWSLDHELELDRGAAAGTKTFRWIAEQRARLGVAVRVLLWDNSEMAGMNDDANTALNKLRTEQGLDVYSNLDDHTAGGGQPHMQQPRPIARVPLIPLFPPLWYNDIDKLLPPKLKQANQKGNVLAYGSHHHKILLVYGRDGLVGFCGGADIHRNRLPGSKPELHDVQLRVTGAAAGELLKIAEQRWAYAKDNGAPPVPSTISVLSPASFPATEPAPYLARVVQTVGNPDLKPVQPNTLWPAIRHAMRSASKFIYIEDQYLWSLDLVKEIADASKRVRHVTLLVPSEVVGEYTQLRQRALGELVRLGGSQIQEKVRIFEISSPVHDWVHSKLFVFDDEYAIVGSANANNRGYFLDSEANVCVAEREWKAAAGKRTGTWSALEANFARRLRIDLWSEHLGLSPEELFDGVGARTAWDVLPPAARVARYQAVNLKAYMEARDKYFEELAEYRANGGAPPRWEDPLNDTATPGNRRPWWEGPKEDWDPGWSPGDGFVDPKD